MCKILTAFKWTKECKLGIFFFFMSSGTPECDI